MSKIQQPCDLNLIDPEKVEKLSKGVFFGKTFLRILHVPFRLMKRPKTATTDFARTANAVDGKRFGHQTKGNKRKTAWA